LNATPVSPSPPPSLYDVTNLAIFPWFWTKRVNFRFASAEIAPCNAPNVPLVLA
jgi:hypothetical protein